MRGGQGLVGAWQLHPASGHEDGEVGVDRPAVVAGGGGSSGRVDMPASSSSCRSGGGGSRVSASGLSLHGLSWVRQLSGWLLPHGFWEESPWALPLEGSLSGAGVGLLLWGSEGNRFSKGCKGPCMGGQPPVISGLGHRWCVASTRAFTPGDASSLLGWLPPGRRQAERAQSKTQVPSRVTGQTRKFPVTDAWLCQVKSSVPEVRGPPKGLLPAPGSLST